MEVPTYTPASAPVPDGVIVIERASTPQDLGPKLNRTAADVVRFLMQQGEMVTATQSLTDVMIELFADELGAEVTIVDPGEEQEAGLQELLAVAATPPAAPRWTTTSASTSGTPTASGTPTRGTAARWRERGTAVSAGSPTPAGGHRPHAARGRSSSSCAWGWRDRLTSVRGRRSRRRRNRLA